MKENRLFVILSLLSGGLISISLLFLISLGQYFTFLRVDKKSYADIRSAWIPKNLPLAKHFPIEIPKKAQGVRIGQMNKLLQSLGVFELSMILPEKEIIIAKNNLKNKDDLRVSNDCNNGFNSYLYPDTKNEDFEVFYLNLKNKIYVFPQGDLNFCNHGYTRGIAFKKDSNLIIYFTTIW